MIPSFQIINDSILSKIPFRRNGWTNVFFTNCFCVILIYFLVIPALISPGLIDAQILSGQSRNNGSTSNQSGDNLLSTLRDPSILSANLSSAAERVVDVIEDRIDTRLQGIKDRLDDIAAIAIPVMITAVAGVVVLAALIIAFILFYWYERFRRGRKHKRDLIHLSEHILQESKENIRHLEKAEHLSNASEEDSNTNRINTNDRPLTKEEVSNSALKVGVSSSMFWDLPSNAQSIILMLLTTIDGYNKVFQQLHELIESVTLNK